MQPRERAFAQIGICLISDAMADKHTDDRHWHRVWGILSQLLAMFCTQFSFFLPRESHGRRGLVGYSPRVANSRRRLSDFTFLFHSQNIHENVLSSKHRRISKSSCAVWLSPSSLDERSSVLQVWQSPVKDACMLEGSHSSESFLQESLTLFPRSEFRSDTSPLKWDNLGALRVGGLRWWLSGKESTC